MRLSSCKTVSAQDGQENDEEWSGWTPQKSGPPADQIDPLVDESDYQDLSNLLGGFLGSVLFLIMVIASLWQQPRLPASEVLVGVELWAVVLGCGTASLGAHLVFTRTRLHVKDGVVTIVGAARELSFPVRDIAEVGTRFGYAHLRLRNGQGIVILGLEAAPFRLDADLERFQRDFKAALPRINNQLGPSANPSAEIHIRWLPLSRGLVLLLIAWVVCAAVAAYQQATMW